MKSCLFFAEAQTLKAIKRSPDPSYVNLGDTLILNVTYTYNSTDNRVGVTWRNSKGEVYMKKVALVEKTSPIKEHHYLDKQYWC